MNNAVRRMGGAKRNPSSPHSINPDGLRCAAPILRNTWLLLLLLLSSPAWADWKTPRENLEQLRTLGEFHVYFAQDGGNAFPADAVLSQLEQANHFYADTLGLVPPLRNPRYRDVRSIDVHILALENKMGDTGDAAIRYRYRHFDAPTPALTISLSDRWRPSNLTPAHELFHAYQYGYTYFKTSWYLEGWARSMESAFENRAPASVPLPQTAPELQEVMARSYRASTFWSRLMQLCDPTCKPSSDKAAQPQLCGSALVRPVLEQFQALDDVAAKDRGIDPADWPEAEQRSDKNNPYLLLGLRRALEAQCPLDSSPELRRFHSLLPTTLP